MAYTQMNPLSSTEGRLLEGENGLAYWCVPAILYSKFLFLILFSFFSLFFFYFNSFPLFSFFLGAYLFSVMVIVVL